VQLLGIYVYSRDGRRRDITFTPGKLNIITGASKTGKSALIDILEYCLGSGECRVPPGVIRDSAAWYGIKLVSSQGEIFVGRADPGEKKSSTDIYVDLGVHVEVPEFSALQQNNTTDALVSMLGTISGIEPNQHEVEPTRTSPPLEANFKHALKFSIQRQDEVARRSQLFHSQEDPFISLALRDSLPYFLGVVSDDRLRKQSELRRLTSVERGLQKELTDLVLPLDVETSMARLLIAEAQDVGLIETTAFATAEDVKLALRRALSNELDDADFDVDTSAGMQALRQEREELSSAYKQQRERLALITGLAEERDEYAIEAQDRIGRLSPTQAIKNERPVDHCPLCQSLLAAIPPSVALLSERLSDLRSQVGSIGMSKPTVDRRMHELRIDVERLRLKLRSNHQSIMRLTEQHDQLIMERPLHLQQSHVRGRISLYLESLDNAPDPKSELNDRLKDVQAQIEKLRDDLSATDVVERLKSALNIIGIDMTQLAQQLDFEFSGAPLRLDVTKLMVIADRTQGPIEMRQMGSGSNWIACHVVAHLALHRWFARENRPVPHFLILDQPTQVYYPPERDVDGRVDVLDNEDRRAVNDLFALLFAFSDQLDESMQIIVLDHASLDNERFRGATIETWRKGKKLIPPEWLAIEKD